MTNEADVNADAVTLPVEKEKAEEMPMSPRGGRNGDREGLDEATLDTSEMSYFFGQAIFGGAMMAVGYSYTWEHHNEGNVDGVRTDEDNLCPNGATYWLWIAGILLLVSNSIYALAKIDKKCAERDGKTDFGEKVGMVVISFSSSLIIVDLAMLIWGSVVVFGAWSNWTDDFNAYKDNPEEMNFCQYTPMMTAFVILLPVMIAITLCCACCCGNAWIQLHHKELETYEERIGVYSIAKIR